MNTRNFVRLGAVGAAASVAMLAAGPALAAAPVAQASANALTLTLGGQNLLAGTPLSSTYTATTDGTNETTTGNKNPALTAVGALKLVGVGTAAQDATATAPGGNGTSAACAGLAGPGATIAAVGNAGSCLTGGSALNLSPATVDLTGLTLSNAVQLPGGQSLLDSILGTQVTSQLQSNLLGPVEQALSSALQQALTSLQLGLNLKLGAVTGNCNAVPGHAVGDASVASAKLTLTVPSQGEVTIVDLGQYGIHPPANTHVLTNLSSVITAIEASLQTELATILNGQLAPLTNQLGPALNQIITAVNQNLIKQIEPQLAPLEQNLLDITLNKQSGIGTDHIDVTALDLQLLPAAKQFVGDSLVHLSIGHVTCGPNSRIVVTPLSRPGAVPPHVTHKVPHKVTSGLATEPTANNGHTAAYAALAGLGALATAAGAIGFRRRLTKG